MLSRHAGSGAQKEALAQRKELSLDGLVDGLREGMAESARLTEHGVSLVTAPTRVLHTHHLIQHGHKLQLQIPAVLKVVRGPMHQQPTRDTVSLLHHGSPSGHSLGDFGLKVGHGEEHLERIE